MTQSGSLEEVLVVRRIIPAPRHRVFDAWLDADSLVRWMVAAPATKASVEVDARVGGKFRIVMSHADRAYEHTGEYLAIERPSHLSFTWRSIHTDLRVTIVTVEFLERGEDTEVILTHRRLPPSQIDNHRAGWTDILRLLGDTLAGQRGSGAAGK
jgi:uncharacterized protein YndB with AHSA1/START domain